MKALIDFDGAGTLVANTKALVAEAISAHNSDSNSHGNLSSSLKISVGDIEPTDTGVTAWINTSDYST